MLSKILTPFLISLGATAVFAWFVAMVCEPDESPDTASLFGIQSAEAASLPPTVGVINAYPKLTFDSPVEYTYAPDGSDRVFVVEQKGIIKAFENSPSAASAPVFLDIRSKVTAGGEMGLLGLAFHPKFRENGYFFVNYTKNNPRETVVSRYKASPGATTVDPKTEVILFRFNQPYANHNGGKVLFGPDGYLYVSTGDGGSGGDPQNNGQNRASWLGKILRIDVNGTEKGHYGIPADNPFANNKEGYREEIFAYGLRNPWRISFDEQDRLWAGDVGQNEIEEIDIVHKGGNYGWRIKEGNDEYNSRDEAPNTGKLMGPVWQYPHQNGNVSVTGGYVYRGSAVPNLRGKYVYADYASGRVWALTPNGDKQASNQELIPSAGTISAFGEDQKNELYLCDYGAGHILKLTPGR